MYSFLLGFTMLLNRTKKSYVLPHKKFSDDIVAIISNDVDLGADSDQVAQVALSKQIKDVLDFCRIMTSPVAFPSHKVDALFLPFMEAQSSLLTNQFTGAWTHYTDTLQGTRTDHMMGSFQRILIE